MPCSCCFWPWVPGSGSCTSHTFTQSHTLILLWTSHWLLDHGLQTVDFYFPQASWLLRGIWLLFCFFIITRLSLANTFSVSGQTMQYLCSSMQWLLKSMNLSLSFIHIKGKEIVHDNNLQKMIWVAQWCSSSGFVCVEMFCLCLYGFLSRFSGFLPPAKKTPLGVNECSVVDLWSLSN